jgi:hypothetical protein
MFIRLRYSYSNVFLRKYLLPSLTFIAFILEEIEEGVSNSFSSNSELQTHGTLPVSS